jgi:hypothetical protein
VEAPDRAAVSQDELCAAADYRACAVLGCRGNRAAAAVATTHGLDVDCASIDRLSRSERKEYGRSAIAQTAKLKDRMCACKDLPCAEQVRADDAAWAEAHKRSEMEPNQEQELEDEAAKLVVCEQRVLQAVPPAAAAVQAPGGTVALAASEPAPAMPPDALESRAILARKPTTQVAKVKHILPGWSEVHHDERGAHRDRTTLERLVKIATSNDKPRGCLVFPGARLSVVNRSIDRLTAA